MKRVRPEGRAEPGVEDVLVLPEAGCLELPFNVRQAFVDTDEE